MSARRVLITGLSTPVGGRLAQALERDPGVQSIIGLDTADPRHELQRAEFVRAELEPAVLRRILRAAAVDTVIDTRLASDALRRPLAQVHANNLQGTDALLSACVQAPVRKLVFKSSAHFYGCGPGHPAFITEDIQSRARTAIERDVAEAERLVADHAARHHGTTVTVLRLADEIDTESAHTTLLSLPAVPGMLGFDPRWQFVHADDLVGALAFAARHNLPGAYNVAGDGVLVLSEIASLLGKTWLPVLPPWGAGFAAAQLRRLGLRVPVETVRQLRYGRALDNRRLKAAGYRYRYTTREAVLKLRERQRLRPLLEMRTERYRYDADVEEFLRWSPTVRSADARAAPRPEGGPALDAYDRLSDTELIELIASLDPDALSTLRRYEAAHQARTAVLDALDRTLARKRGA